MLSWDLNCLIDVSYITIQRLKMDFLVNFQRFIAMDFGNLDG
jgi:hypothetical protein